MRTTWSPATLSLPEQRYSTFTEEQGFFNQLKENFAGMPGLESVTVAAGVPPHVGFSFDLQMEFEGRPVAPTDPHLELPFSTVDPNYFQVMRIPLLKGRSFGAQDTIDAPPSVIINDEMARHYWPGPDVVGKRFRTSSRGKWLTVVGVVGDVKVQGLNDPMGKMQVYLSLEPAIAPRLPAHPDRPHNLESERADSRRQKPYLGARQRSADLRITTVDYLFDESLAEPRFYLLLMSCFAGVALLLVSMGIYSVIAYLVSQRTHEIGIRIALGARTVDVLRLVLRQGMGLVLAGVGLGAIGAYAATRLISTMLFGISPTDPLTFVGIMLLLMSVGLARLLPPPRVARPRSPRWWRSGGNDQETTMLKKLFCGLWLTLVFGGAAESLSRQSAAPPAPDREWQRAALAEIQKRIVGHEKEPARRSSRTSKCSKAKMPRVLPGMMTALTGLLGVDCAYCHVRDQWDKEEKPTKQITRQHFAMQAEMNKDFFAGQNAITCWTCHRGQPKPEKVK